MARSVIGALRVTLGLDSAEFETGIKRASKTTQTFTRASKDVKAASDQISSSLRGVGAALGITSLTAAGVAYMKLADQSKLLAAQLNLATASFGNFGQAQKDVTRIASDARSGLSETGSLYSSFLRTAQELGAQQYEAARATETFSKALKVGGAGTQEVSSATLQMGQALSSANVQWEELGQILEASPRLGRLFTDALGVTRGELKKMAEDGKLSSDMLFRALTDRKFTDTIDAEFKLMPVTFGDAVQQITNSATIAFGAFDRGGQFSTAIANFATDGAGELQDMELAAERFGITLRTEINAVSETVRPLLDLLGGVREALSSIETSVPKNWKLSPESLGGTSDIVTSLWRAPQGAARGVYAAANGGSFSKEYSNFMSSTSAANYVRQIQGNIDKANVQATLGRIWQGNPLVDAPRTTSVLKPAATTVKPDKGTAKAAEAARKRAQREAEKAADALRQFADEVDREASTLSSTLAELTGTTEAKRDADLKQIEADRGVRERAIKADDDIDAAKKAQLISLNDENAAARKRVINQRAEEDVRNRTIRSEQERADLAVELMQYSADAARTARDRRAIELRILETQFNEEESRLRLEALSTDLEKAASARLRLAQLPAIREGATDQVMRATQGPLESYLDRIPKSAAEAKEALERIEVDGIDSLIDGLAGVASGARSLGDVFKNVANQIIADIVRINLQRMLVGSGGGGFLGSLLGGFGAFTGGNALGGVSASSMAYIDGMASQLGSPKNLTGFATGGSFKVGGSSAIGDQQLVSFRANRGEMVDIRKPGNDNRSGAIAHIVPSPYFNVVVDGRAAGIAAPLSAQAANAGSQGAQVALARKGSRAIP
jgi:tape measure domain-containing protein